MGNEVQKWSFDQFVGSKRARELGLWKSNDDPDRTWRVEGSVSLTRSGPIDEDEPSNLILTVEADGEKLTIASDRDQWGTWYTIHSGEGSQKQIMAQEDGTRSFLRALIAGLQFLESQMDHQTKD